MGGLEITGGSVSVKTTPEYAFFTFVYINYCVEFTYLTFFL
jgi:hypothetical protein